MTIHSFCRNLTSIALLCVFAHAQEVQTLTPGKPIEREIANGQTHTYRFTLQAGQFVQFDVQQKSCDVLLTWIAPDGKKLLEADTNRVGLPETLSHIASEGGEYQLLVQTGRLIKMSGHYQLRFVRHDKPTEQHQQRIVAEGLTYRLFQGQNAQQRMDNAQQALTFWRGLGERYWEAHQLIVISFIHSNEFNQHDKAMELTEQALVIARERKAPTSEAMLITNLGFFHNRKGQADKSIEFYERALAMYREQGNKFGAADLLNRLAFLYRNTPKREQAAGLHEEALALYREVQYKPGQASALVGLGDYSFSQAEYEKASGYYEQAKIVHREVGNISGEAGAMNAQGMVAQRLKKNDEAQKLYETAIEMVRGQKAKSQEAFFLRNLAQLYSETQQFEKAATTYEQAILLAQELKDPANEALSLLGYGVALRSLQQHEKALRAFENSLTISRERKNKFGEGRALVHIAVGHLLLGSFEQASEAFEKALQLSAEEANVSLEDVVLNRTGSYFFDLSKDLNRRDKVGEQLDKLFTISRSKNYLRAESLFLLQLGYIPTLSPQQHISHLERALELTSRNQRRNHSVAVDCLRSLAGLHVQIADYENSVKYTLRSLELAREVKDRVGEASALLDLGAFYSYLGHAEKATQTFEQALAKAREFKSVDVERGTFLLLGQHYARIGLYDKVIEMHDQAIALLRRWKHPGGESAMFSLLANAYVLKGDFAKSIEASQQALKILQENRIELRWGGIHFHLGEAHRGLKQYDAAIRYHQQSALLAGQHQPGVLWEPYSGLMKDYDALKLPQPAIFWGKQAVNTIQGLREKMVKLDRDVQQNFIKSKEDIYRSLADLLIAQGRLPEAEQVIRMLKDEEYFDYIRRDNKNGPKGEKASLTPEEQAAEKRYREIADQLAGIGTERSTLLGKMTRSPEEEQRLAKLETDLTVASQVFQKFLEQLNTELSGRKAGDSSVAQLNESQAFMDDLREMGKGAVALYTVVSDEKFHVILTTSDVRKSYSYPIKAAELNRKVLAFRTALQNPKLDPLPLAQELYKIIVAPMAKDLQAAKAETLMWSLDGVLRYVPMAALHDGDKYLVERWRNVVFTAASKARLKDDPSRKWKALGLGVTKAHGERIPALPAVADEMRSIIRETGSKTGVLPGTIKLDEQFTQETMQAGLRQQPSVVHVASHFQFQPGNETNSALLLGDGKFLSLAQIKTLPNVFRGVELLTLSACNTAMGSGGSGSDANGKEIEGFGMMAQNQGAKAVVASLWPVADRSTKELMQAFYQLRESNHSMKSEALRQAQCKLMRGELVMTVDLTKREIVHEADKTANQPSYKSDPKKPYAHPYYWAPFILIGNWK